MAAVCNWFFCVVVFDVAHFRGTKCVTQGSGRLDGFAGASVIVGLVIKLEDWCNRRQRPLLGGGFVRRSPLPPISAHLRLFGTRPCGSIVQQVVGFAAHGLSLSGPLPRCGRVARGEWGNLAVRGCLIIWENAYWVDSRQMRQMRVLISDSSGTFGKQSKS